MVFYLHKSRHDFTYKDYQQPEKACKYWLKRLKEENLFFLFCQNKFNILTSAVSKSALIASCNASVRAQNSLKLILIGITFYAGSRRIKGRIWFPPLVSTELTILLSLVLNPGLHFLRLLSSHLLYIKKDWGGDKGVINNIIVLLATLPVVLNRALSSRGSTEQLHIYADNESNPFLTPRPPPWIVLKQSKLR